jgi:flagellar secretion chaperone FliS
MSAVQRYAQSQAETASPERLTVMLFEAALRHMRSGAAALEAGRPGEASGALARAGDIVVELHATLDVARAPELCRQLGEVYRFVCLRLLHGSLRRDPGPVREAERAFAPLAEAFAGAVQAVAGGAR